MIFYFMASVSYVVKVVKDEPVEDAGLPGMADDGSSASDGYNEDDSSTPASESPSDSAEDGGSDYEPEEPRSRGAAVKRRFACRLML